MGVRYSKEKRKKRKGEIFSWSFGAAVKKSTRDGKTPFIERKKDPGSRRRRSDTLEK